MDIKNEIVNFFKKYINEFEPDGGSGTQPGTINFDLTPRDFLDFAEKDLAHSESVHSLVNATSNLKRAVDCQLDCFLVLLNLDKFYRSKRLGVDRKLGFLERAGLFRSKSLEKLNKMRNELEHQYAMPKISDVEVYFDLVVAFVSVIESNVTLVGHNSEIGMSLDSGGMIETKYIHSKPAIAIRLEHVDSNYRMEFMCDLSNSESNIETSKEFAFFLKVHSLLNAYYGGVASSKHVLQALET
ncbi:hypothetical protein NDJ59_22705 [Vibrio parahaemolyticus]|uniref:RiboL-PSP-HEPN domain-containing protein n=1 Tax=Vibrio parahaemolyticus TaxID=670 RepID=A0AAW3IT48_VIBPH|nr:hypothetical protein [Vibrio parahaemolyticus]KOY28426.1 hypothetical protein ACX05_18720 [Vibrio parahaemolyticus]MCS0103055.1 hypothetical protein [Vibrio parahaemolyticus]OTW18649.1 hypothetical protein BA745_22805 [Vibrio parahaemolyticus]OTW24844.1 hypothetical protein BA744_03925 [Vibrio parahaemolyticus]